MLGIGVVGLGGIAKSHLTALQIAEDEGFARCVAAADLVEDLRESHRKEWEIPAVYPNHHKLLEDPNVDAVAIVLGHHLHADLTIDALNAGRHVLVEKPMANTLEECDRMIEAEQASGKILQIGMTGRFHPAMRKAREILDSNELGPVVTALSRFNKNWGYGGRRYQYRTRWMGGGMWMGNGVHAVDWLTHCIGARAVAVKAKQSTSMHYQGADDVTTAFVQYANGIPGLLVVVGSVNGCATDGIEAHCALGEIQYNVRGSLRVGQNKEWREVEHDGKHGFCEQYRHFAQSIAMGMRPQTSGEYGRHIVEILQAAETSSITGREVHLTDYHRMPW